MCTKMKILTRVITIVMALSFQSCEKLLEVTPDSSITEQTYFTSEADFEPYLVGTYTFMRTFSNFDIYGSQRGDEYVNGINSRLNAAANLHQLSATNGAVDWQQWYTAIGNCNLLLDKIQKFSFASNPDSKKRILAETHALRAYFYFNLTRIFGKVPLMLEAVVNDNVPLLERSSEAEVMKQIQLDIAASIENFTSISNFSKSSFPSTKYRFSHAAVQALKMDSRLWSAKVLSGGNNDFTEVLKAAVEVEAAGNALNSDFRNVIAARASNNTEHILSSFFLRDEGATNFAVNLMAISSHIVGVINADSIISSVSPSYAQSGYLMSPLAVSWFSDKRDKRIPFTYVVERRASGPASSVWVVKHPGTKYADDRVADNDLPIYRLADILLMKAEAQTGLGNLDEAVKELNRIKARAGIDAYKGQSEKKAIELEILSERGRELFAENKRWYDLVRFHKGGSINLYEALPNLKGKTTPLYWPISLTVLAKNEKLVQTEGY